MLDEEIAAKPSLDIQYQSFAHKSAEQAGFV
jgi:hypothetical protein